MRNQILTDLADMQTIFDLTELRVHVTGGDYDYDGTLVAVFQKLSGAVRYVVEDEHRRLFIHNAKQLGKDEGWHP